MKLLLSLCTIFIAFSTLAVITVFRPADAPPNYFISTVGSPSGSGRLSSPLDLMTVKGCSTNSCKTNGAIFWLRGGTYAVTTNALCATGIVMRPYPGEIPIIQDSIVQSSASVSNTIRGLTFVAPYSSRTLSNAQVQYFADSFWLGAEGTRTIGNNLVGYFNGLSSWKECSNSLHYGDIILAHGYILTNGAIDVNGDVVNNGVGIRACHSLYCQNQSGTKIISLCHFLFSGSTSVDIRGTSLAGVNNVYFQSNFISNGELIGQIASGNSYEFVTARGDVGVSGVSNVWITDNMIIRDRHHGDSMSIGLGDSAQCVAGTNYDFHFDRNYCDAGFANLASYSTFTFWTNTIWTDCASYGGVANSFTTIEYNPNSIEGTAWYYTPANHPWFAYTNNCATTVAINTFNEWKSFVSGDQYGTYSNSYPVNVVAEVWKNEFRDSYDQWWGDVVIWNPKRISNNVFVALSGIPSGTKIDVRYTGNILGGSVLQTTYDGSGIMIPMTNLPTYKPNDPAWPQLPQPTNGASFRIFLTDFVAPSAQAVTMRAGTIRMGQ